MPQTTPQPLQPDAAAAKVEQPDRRSLVGMRALSVRQPWAWAIVAGAGLKTTEYRTFGTTIRGRILIYASRTRYSRDDEADFAAELSLSAAEFDALPRGCVIGSVEISGCEYSSYGDDFAWSLANPVQFAKPIAPISRPMPAWFYPFGSRK